jgi:hypothetical protein
MRKLSKRTAVSSVLGTILMVLVVVVGMSLAFAYFVSFVKDYQAGRGASTMELVSVEDVWFNGGGNSIEMWLYNYGKLDVTIGTFYVDGQQVSLIGVDVPIGGHVPVTVQRQWFPGLTYHFKLVTDRGSVFEGDYASPST